MEQARIAGWLARIADIAPRDYELAIAVAECQRLVKGYGETHARGWRNFEMVMQAARRLEGRPDAAARLAVLREAALADEAGAALADAIAALEAAA